MISNNEDILLGHRYIYDKSGKDYAVTTLGRMKVEGVWRNCVIYVPMYQSKHDCFVRTVDDFKEHFSEVNDIVEL